MKRFKPAIYGVIAEDIKQKFTRIAFWCDAHSDYHSQMTSTIHLAEQEEAFGISYSGQIEEIISGSSRNKKQGATVMLKTRAFVEFADVK
jgi:DNA-binding MurR/RpiR family transcriptional regulator